MTSPAKGGARRKTAFAVLCAVCLAIPVEYGVRVGQRIESSGPIPAPATVEAERPAPPEASAVADVQARRTAEPGSPRPARSMEPPARLEPLRQPIVFRYTGIGESYGRVVRADLETPHDMLVTPLRCDRLHLGGGQGVCLVARRGVFTTYEAILFDAEFKARYRFPLSGLPSRARVSADGRLAAITVFESGHSYAAANFSTRTSIVDVQRGDVIVPDMEKFSVVENGAPLHEIDFNFWGVTFARDSNRFYATLGTRGRTYLVEGDVAARSVRVLREGVECPSLSPDNTRIAFKRRQGGTLSAVTWRLSVLRLDTLEERPLAESRSVDDQVDWLDDDAVLYSLPEASSGTAAMDTWLVPAGGEGPPRMVVPKAYSLSLIRNRHGR